MLSTNMLRRLRLTAEQAMQDKCVIGVYHAVPDAYGIPTPTYRPGSPVPCGLNESDWREVQSKGEVVLTDAVLRLPAGTVLDSRDRITITHRYGIGELTEKPVYSIIGFPQVGTCGLQVKVNLRLVTED